MNTKGFTLIELLAVTLILGILITIAIPNVTSYLSNSKKSLFIDDAKQNQTIVGNDIVFNKFKAPLDKNDVTIISIGLLEHEKDKYSSSFGFPYLENKSYVAVVNIGTPENPIYDYYVALQDGGRNAIPLTNYSKIDSGSFVKNAKNKMELTVQSFCGNEEGVFRSLYTIKGLEDIQEKNELGYLKNWNATIYSSEDCGRMK